MAGPVPIQFYAPPLPDQFLGRVLSVIAGTPQGYTWEEWWLTGAEGDPTWEAKTGGRNGGTTNPGYTSPAADLSEVLLAVGDFAWVRSADGAAGSVWEMVPVVSSGGTGGTAEGFLAPCRCATTANITIASALDIGDVIDGITLALNDRVFVHLQSAAEENGVYVVGNVSPSRATDADSGDKLVGAQVRVVEGTVNSNTSWACVTPAPIVIDTDPNVWAYQYPHPSGTDGYVLVKDSTALSGTRWDTSAAVVVSGGGATWVKYSIPLATFQAAGAVSDADFTIFTLPGGSLVHSIVFKHTAKFDTPFHVAWTASFTNTTAFGAGNLNVSTTPSSGPMNTGFQVASVTSNAGKIYMADFSSGTAIQIHLHNIGVETLNNLTSGSMDVYALVSTLP